MNPIGSIFVSTSYSSKNFDIIACAKGRSVLASSNAVNTVVRRGPIGNLVDKLVAREACISEENRGSLTHK